jgi:FAD binding domain
MRTTDELEWDLAVDFVCVGAGAGGLAAAIVAVDAGASAFVASFGRPLDGTSRNRLETTLGSAVGDRETNGYMTSLTEDLEPSESGEDVPVLVAGDLIPVSTKKPGKKDQVPPFFGGRLGEWAAMCVASPFGVVYSRVITDATCPKRSRSGAMVEVARIGSLELDPDAPAPALDRWLSSAASDRGIDVHDEIWLQHLVFEDGQVVGAVFDTPTATLAVRATNGVMLACDADGTNIATPALSSVPAPTTAEVCLVREPLSRFSRLELHVRESSVRSFVSARGR